MSGVGTWSYQRAFCLDTAKRFRRIMVYCDLVDPEGRTSEDDAYFIAASRGVQNVVVEDDVILTIATTNPVTAIRWKPVPKAETN